jgi:hypothetical protein
MLDLLGDVFRRSQNVTDKEFIAKLEQRGIEHAARGIDTGTYIEVGRFGYGTGGGGEIGWKQDHGTNDDFNGELRRPG